MRFLELDQVKDSILFHINFERKQLDILEKVLAELTQDDVSFTRASEIFKVFMSKPKQEHVDFSFLHISSRVMVRTSKTDEEADEASNAVIKYQNLEDRFNKENTEKKEK